MDKKKRNVAALGALTTLAFVIFFWGFYYLLGNPVFKSGMDVVVALDNGAGLKRGDRVQVQGVEVGSVKSIALEGSQRVIAVLRLNDKLLLPADTRARVSGDMFGAHAVELVPGSALVKLEQGDTIGGMSAPALADMAGELGSRATGFLTRADSLLSSETVRDLRATASVLPASALELRAAFTELRLASAALRRTAEEVEGVRTGAALHSAVSRVEESARALTGTANALEQSASSLANVIRKIDSGQGTLGRLVNDSTLYFEFFGAAREIRTLAADVRARPRRYINIGIF